MINIYSPDKQELRQVNMTYLGVIPESPGSKGRVIIGRIKENGVMDMYDVPNRILAGIREELVQGAEITLFVKPSHHSSKRDIMFGDGQSETVDEIKPVTKF